MDEDDDDVGSALGSLLTGPRDFLFPGQATRRQSVEQAPELQRIAAGPGHAAVGEQRRQFETQQALTRAGIEEWQRILQGQTGGLTPTPEAVARARRLWMLSTPYAEMGQAGRALAESLGSLVQSPTAPEAFTLPPGSDRFIPDQSVTEETVLPDGRRVPRGMRMIQGPPPTPPPPRPYESSVDRTRTEMLQAAANAGTQAEAQLQELTALTGPLLRIGEAFPQGTWRARAASMGLPVGQSATDLQVVQSILDGLTPLQRRGLPGAASDRDVAMFRGRLPELMRTAEGNREILAFLLAQARSQVTAGGIAREAFTRRDADPAEVMQRLGSVTFTEALAETRRELAEHRAQIVEGSTGVNVRAIARMTDQQLREFTTRMTHRFPQGIPAGIRRRIMTRADEISRDMDN